MTKGKSNKYIFWHSPLILAVFFFILVLFIYKTADLIKKEIQTTQRKELMEKQISDLNERKFSLENDILKLETDEGKEEIIREKYQVAKEGEKMVIIVEDEDKVLSSPTEKENPDSGFWDWLKKIFNRK